LHLDGIPISHANSANGRLGTHLIADTDWPSRMRLAAYSWPFAQRRLVAAVHWICSNNLSAQA